MQAVIARERCEAEVGDDEPLRRLRRPVLGIVHRFGGKDISARLQLRLQLADRDGGRHLLVDVARDVDRSFPDLLALLRLDVVGFPQGELAQERAGGDGVSELAVADAEELGVHLRGVDGDDRDRRLAAGRKHVGSAEEARSGCAVAHQDVQLDALRQRLAVGGRQPLPRRQMIAAAMLDAVDADLLAVRLDGEIGRRPRC